MSKLDYPLTFHPSLPLGEEMNVSENPVDTGLIQCICESTEDDGFTIQCDRCLTWQHAYCMNINQNNIPDRYLCDNCVKRIPSATTHNLSNGGKDTQRSTSKLSNNNSTDSELENNNNNNNNNKPTSTKRKEEKLKPNGSARSFSNKSNTHNKRSRELQSLDDYSSVGSNIGNNSKDSSSTHTGKAATTVKKPKLSKRISVPKRSLQRNMMMMVDSERDLMTKATTKLHTKKKDKYQPTNINTVKSKFVYEVIKEIRDRWKQSPKWKSQPWRASSSMDDHTTTALQQTSNKKSHCGPFTVMDTLSLQQSSSTNIAIRSLPRQQQQQQQQQQHHHHHHHQHHPRSSSSYKLRKGAFADTPLHANTFLLEAHGEMVLKSEYKFDATNDYSLLGTACAHVLFYPTVDLCIDGRQLGNETRHFRRSCHPNAELRTMIFPRQKRRPPLSITTTHTGGIGDSDIGDDDDDDDDGWQKEDSLIRLGIFTRVPIQQGEEITLGWNWQKGHISWRKNVEWYRSSSSEHEHHQNRTLAHVKSDPMVDGTTIATSSGDIDLSGNNSSSSILLDGTGDDEESDRHTRYAIQQMLERFDSEFGDCACSEDDVCLIERLRQECDMLSSAPVLLNGRIEPTVSATATTTKSSMKPSSTSSSLQHSRQIIVAPSTISPGSKSENEKMVTTGHSPAAGSVEENVEIDVISMSPGVAATLSPANHTTALGLDQVKMEANSDVDDELDIDGDIDIGDDDIPALTKTSVSSTLVVPAVAEETKPVSAQLQQYGSSLSSTSSLSGTDSDGNGDATNRKKKGRRVFKKSKHDPGLDSTEMTMTTTPIASNKPSALPRKKVWMQHFLQHNVKTENVAGDPSDPDKQKSLGIDDSGDRHDAEMDVVDNQVSTCMEIHGNTDGNGGVDSAMDKTKATTTTTKEDAMDMDLDDGELSDASSASTIPLDEDDRDWTLRTQEQQPPSEQPRNQPSDHSATSTQKPVIDDDELPVDTTSNTVTATPPPPPISSAPQQEITPSEEKSNEPPSEEEKPTSLSTKAPSSSTEEQAEEDQQQRNETTNTGDGNSDTGKEAQDELDQAKPTKVKVSLQEYLSRRMASKEPPKSATAPNPHHQVN